jgi:hypothetical protein
MNRLDNLLIGVCALLVLVVVCWFGVHHYGAERYDAGYAAAVAAGQAQHDRDAATALKTQSDLRAKLALQDVIAQQKEIEHAQTLADAQRRVRAGTDRLRCPASPVQPTAAPEDRPVAPGPGVDGQGAELVPDAAAEVLGDGATAAGIVRKFDRLKQRFEECRAVNAK